MEILIVVPKYATIPFYRYEFPMGLAYVSAVLKKAGHRVEILNLNKYYGPINLNDWAVLDRLISRRIETGNYQVVMTGGLSPFFDMIQQIFTAARRAKPDIISIVGGGVISSEPLAVMQEIGADIGVVGEGEETVVELMAALQGGGKLADVRGIVYRGKNGQLAQTPPRPPIDDIEALPFPDYDGFDVDLYLERQLPHDMPIFSCPDKPRLMPVLGSRSCPFKCSFCFHPVGDKYRLRSLDSVFAEIEHLIERYRINALIVLDELFGYNKKYFVDFCERIKGYGLAFGLQMHVSQANERNIGLLKEAGCRFISYGIESVNNEVLKSMGKHSSIEQIDRALKLTYDHGINIQGNLLFGEKAETIEAAKESINWRSANLRYMINHAILVPYPGSKLWNLGIERGIIGDKIDFIRNECAKLWRLNLSRMSRAEYDWVFSTIRHNDYFHRIPAKVLSCKQLGINPFKGPLYALSIECPHCGEVVDYTNMHSRFDDEPPFYEVRISCRKCNQRFDVLPFRVEEGLHNLLRTHTGARIAILGANSDSISLLRFSPAVRERVACVVDDLALQGLKTVEGFPVIPLSNNIGQIAQMADLLFAPPRSLRDCHLAYLSDLGPQGLSIELARHGVQVVSLSSILTPLNMETEQACIAYVREAFEKANRAAAAGSLEAAFNIYLSIVQKFPAVAQAHRSLGEVSLAMGEQDIALDALYTANVLDPTNVDTLVKLGLALFRANQQTQAISRYNEALAIQPGHWEAFFNLAMSAVTTRDCYTLLEVIQGHIDKLSLHESGVREGLLAIYGAVGEIIPQRNSDAPALAKSMNLLANHLRERQRASQCTALGS